MPAVMTGYAESGLSNPKFVRRRQSDGAWWNTSGTPAFEAYDADNIADYGIAAAEDGTSGVYTATDPDPDTAGDYVLVAAAGASLSQSDLTDNPRWQERMEAVASAVLAAAASAPIASNVKEVNDITVDGSGTSADPWGPA